MSDATERLTPETLRALAGRIDNAPDPQEQVMDGEDLRACADAWEAEVQRLRERLDMWPEAIAWVREHYPEDVFPPDSQSPDARAARMGRLTCDNIVRRHQEELAARERVRKAEEAK